DSGNTLPGVRKNPPVVLPRNTNPSGVELDKELAVVGVRSARVEKRKPRVTREGARRHEQVENHRELVHVTSPAVRGSLGLHPKAKARCAGLRELHHPGNLPLDAGNPEGRRGTKGCSCGRRAGRTTNELKLSRPEGGREVLRVEIPLGDRRAARFG